MNVRALLLLVGCLFASVVSAAPPAREIPAPLRPWEGWATWDDADRACPTPYNNPDAPLCFWPSRLDLVAEKTGGRFVLTATVFRDAWVPLPGSADKWPQDVKVGGAVVPVVERDGRPCVRLAAGTQKVEGVFRWTEIPQGVSLPQEIGVLTLTLDGRAVPAPTWDAQGYLWLKRDAASEEADKDFLSTKVYALLEDGIPLWLRTQVEIIVSGKSREEDLGSIVPAGWTVAAVQSPLPVMVDDAGRMRVQVRAGKWTIAVDAFRLDNPKEFSYAAGAKPAAEEELVAFQARPDFRMVDITGSPSIDVSQTTFPAAWREFPVYRWDTATPFRIEERMRGMGLQAPGGLRIDRTLWLDESGRALTFRDRIAGERQQIWRLDAAEGQDLGSVRSAGQGQLITLNPQNNAPGVEIRSRNLNLEATGRAEVAGALSATGWRADADHLAVDLNLPPGWRLFALFGADWVNGDWLTAWTLLDLFFLLIFTLAVFRLWGFLPAVLAFLAFGLAYHEPGAPRVIWLLLIIPLALLRVVPDGWGRRLVATVKWVLIVALVLSLAPFVSKQVQQALFPQLEVVPFASMGRSDGFAVPQSAEMEAEIVPNAPPPAPSYDLGIVSSARSSSDASSWKAKGGKDKSNLLYDAKARIQTGPGIPEWTWRTVRYGWNGPVSSGQTVRPILISCTLERILTVLRIALLLGLAAVLLTMRRTVPAAAGRAAVVLAAVFLPTGAFAQEIPDAATLKLLRDRLLEPSDAFPQAAEIPSVALALKDGRLTMDAEIHTAARVAVPLPGRLPAWSPVTVSVNGLPEAALRRAEGFLWVVLPEGVHRVRVEGLLSGATEWEWTFQLKPRRVTIDAPGWTVSGVRPDGVPEAQVFFALQQKSEAGEASYDRADYQPLVQVRRAIELGLVWQVRTTVQRLTPPGKAVNVRVPLLPGENVLSAGAVVRDGMIEVRLGAQQEAFSWESELSVAPALTLSTQASDSWVEHWSLVASPVWNVEMSGLSPIFEASNPDLVPVWSPWPGESVQLTISRPEAVSGSTVTVSRANHVVNLGKRQRTARLELALRCSLGEDFLIGLPSEAEVTTLTFNGAAVPVRKDGDRVVVPLRPGDQTVVLEWKTAIPLRARAGAGAVTLPVEGANITTALTVPDNRWVLWTDGPLRGPAVRFWTVLVCSLLAAWALGRLRLSPLRGWEWMLLALGLTQVPLAIALVVVGWLFFLAWRGRPTFQQTPTVVFNLLQVALIGLTVVTLGIFVGIVAQGLLGDPRMFITGNGSTPENLQWYQPRAGTDLPQPWCLSISIWWFRVLMLLWALWLAASLIRWLRWGWEQFCTGGCFRKDEPPARTVTPPPMPKS